MKTPPPFRGELIGLHARILKARNKHHEGINGIIIDETRNFLILTPNKKILKQSITLQVTIHDQPFPIEGNTLIGRPEDRLTK